MHFSEVKTPTATAGRRKRAPRRIKCQRAVLDGEMIRQSNFTNKFKKEKNT
jgi:hypothetical protein